MLSDKPLAELLHETNRVLNKAVDKGLTDNRPPAEMIDKLRSDVFVFSCCKTHVELKELGAKLVDENGKISSWNRFLSEATALGKKYNEDYLHAEYIFATSSSEMAARWSDVSKDGDRYNLQYRTAGDDRVRDAHARINGTTLPANDPFWDSYYPPNGWRCRCTAVQVLKEKYPLDNSAEKIRIADAATTQIDAKGRDRGAMFRYNPGKQQVIFPPNHPYYKVKQSITDIMSGLDQNSKSKEAAKNDLIAWTKENLPQTKVGKFFARRFEVKRTDIERPIIVNTTFYNEIISKYKTDKLYVKKLSLAKQAHVFIQKATLLPSEKSKHHPEATAFLVFNYTHNGTDIELKCKVAKDGIFLYYMKILK